MKISSAFPSKYLRAQDLQGKSIAVTIERVAVEDCGEGEEKPVVYFKGKTKGLVLNKTNANRISAMLGDETDDWAGHEITLLSTEAEFRGRSVPAIRVSMVEAPARQPEPAHEALTEEEIPF